MLSDFDGQIALIGHTDAAGSALYNLRLGLRRAISTYNAIKKLAEEQQVWEAIKHKIVAPRCNVCEKKGRRRLLTKKFTFKPNNLQAVPHRNKKTGKTIYKICDHGYHVNTKALEACKHTHGEERPVLANNYDNGKKNLGARAANRRVEILRVDGECIARQCGGGVSVAYGTQSWKMKDFSVEALKQKCEAAGCKFTSRNAGTDYLLKLLKHYEAEKCPPRGDDGNGEDDGIPTRHETFLEIGKTNKEYSLLRSGGGLQKATRKLQQRHRQLGRLSNPGSQGAQCKHNILGICKLKSECATEGAFFQIRKGYCNGKYYCCSPTYTTSASCERKSLKTDEQEEVDSAEIEDIEDSIDGEYGSLVRHETRR